MPPGARRRPADNLNRAAARLDPPTKAALRPESGPRSRERPSAPGFRPLCPSPSRGAVSPNRNHPGWRTMRLFDTRASDAQDEPQTLVNGCHGMGVQHLDLLRQNATINCDQLRHVDN